MKDKDEVMRQKLLRLKYDLIELTKQEDGNTIQGIMDAYFRVCEQCSDVMIQLNEALAERDVFRDANRKLHGQLAPLQAELSDLRTALHVERGSTAYLRRENTKAELEIRRLRGSTRNLKRELTDD